MYKCRKREILNALMVEKIQSLFPSTRALIIKDSKRHHGRKDAKAYFLPLGR